jgi:hypothetical protein
MNYLVIEGYKEAAEKFQQESGTAREYSSFQYFSFWDELISILLHLLTAATAGIDLNSISDRMLIRNAIQSGNIEEGIERVNDLNPEVLFIVNVLSTQLF